LHVLQVVGASLLIRSFSSISHVFPGLCVFVLLVVELAVVLSL